MKRIIFFFATLWLGIMGASAQGYHYDVTNDGSVNITDAIAVVNKILGKANPGEIEGCEEVDLGLPSGTIWASINVGATKPEEYGNYYAWGETVTKDTYAQSNYQYYKNDNYVDIGSDISGTQYDVATVLWGADWCMPTKEQIEELISECTYEWTTINGVTGNKFIGPSGKSIFIPAAGFIDGSFNINTLGENYLFISSATNYMDIYMSVLFGASGTFVMNYASLYMGFPVRPVRSGKNSVPAKAVDLGLPSGTKWASCNVGASKPEEYGDYYAWGETGTKLKYNNYTYLFTEENEEHGIVPISLGDDIDGISGSKYDVARMKWGGNWRMPKTFDIMELFENCTNEWTTLNGVNGLKFTSKKNGNSIFLPAAGCYDYNGLKDVGECGYYSSSMLYPFTEGPFPWYSLSIYFSSDSACYDADSHDRANGQSVRPVIRE